MNLPPIRIEDESPFRLPADTRIFGVREDERQRKEIAREINSKVKVWDKKSSDHLSRTDRLQELVGDLAIFKTADAIKMVDNEVKIVVPRRQVKETIPEFISKKREIFLVQMSLDTKREEIRKLEEKAQMKEEALYRSEQLLEEDAMRFDAFLKENDKKAHDAIKRAEEETKRKQEKTQEIKRLTQQIQTLSSEMSKHREALEDCMRYKKFLDLLTPPEWFEQHEISRNERREISRVTQHSKKMKDWETLRRRTLEQHRKEIEARKELKNDRHKRSRAPVDEEEDDESDSKIVLPPAPKLDDEVAYLSDEDPPMYFTRPQQLMDIFAALEEQNLFLIQNSQETEHTLEELQHDYRDTKVTMETRTGLLQVQIDELQQQISGEEHRARILHAKQLAAVEAGESVTSVIESSSKFGAGIATPFSPQVHSQQEKEELLWELNSKVRMVYEESGFDASSKPNTLFMLSHLESRLEALLMEIERMPVDYVIKAEKEKEKRRRERKREEQQALQERLQEERNKRAIERSMQAPKRRIGRQVMYRSRPIRREQKHDGDENNEKDNNDELRFFS